MSTESIFEIIQWLAIAVLAWSSATTARATSQLLGYKIKELETELKAIEKLGAE